MAANMVMKSFHEKIESRATLDAKVNTFIEKYEAEGYKTAMTTVTVQPAVVIALGEASNLHAFITIWMALPAVPMGPPGIIVPVRTAA